MMPGLLQRRSTRWISLFMAGGSVVLIAWLGLYALISGRPADKPISEPISMIYGGVYSDGGSIFVEFKDASGVARSACLLNEMDGDKNLTVDDKVLSINGAEERAFLELLERWLRQDSVAQRYLDGEPLAADETPHINDAGRWFAVSILESLRARKNGGRHDK